MNIFSEIYGAYYRAAAKIMEREKISAEEINGIISEEAFRDSMLFLQPKIIPQKDGSDWGLLRKNDDGSFSPIIKNPPAKIITDAQKMWLKAKLYDPKFRLFLADDTLAALTKRLENVKPLYRPEHFRFPDIFSDGDDYSDENYRHNFRVILAAAKSREILEISFTSGHGQNVHGYFLPLKIEYSRKNDKFRAYVFAWNNIMLSGSRGSGKINIGRIEKIIPTGKIYRGKISMERYFSSRKCGEPVTVFVSTRRNAVERFMMEFAAYEKRTERDTETGCCTVKIWYDRQDETELLIRLLSFGPTIKILDPESFRRQAVQRVKRQYELIYGSDENEEDN